MQPLDRVKRRGPGRPQGNLQLPHRRHGQRVGTTPRVCLAAYVLACVLLFAMVETFTRSGHCWHANCVISLPLFSLYLLLSPSLLPLPRSSSSSCSSVPFTAEHLEALNGWVFQRVPVEEAGIVPAVLEWVKLESQLAYVTYTAAAACARSRA